MIEEKQLEEQLEKQRIFENECAEKRSQADAEKVVGLNLGTSVFLSFAYVLNFFIFVLDDSFIIDNSIFLITSTIPLIRSFRFF